MFWIELQQGHLVIQNICWEMKLITNIPTSFTTPHLFLTLEFYQVLVLYMACHVFLLSLKHQSLFHRRLNDRQLSSSPPSTYLTRQHHHAIKFICLVTDFLNKGKWGDQRRRRTSMKELKNLSTKQKAVGKQRGSD